MSKKPTELSQLEWIIGQNMALVYRVATKQWLLDMIDAEGMHHSGDHTVFVKGVVTAVRKYYNDQS